MYLFLNDARELTAELKRKYDKMNSYGSISGAHRRWRTAYNAYYSNYFVDNVGVGTSGEQNEYATASLNHLRNIIRHIQNLVTQNKLVFDALAVNSDIASRNATIVANAVLEYYFYERRFEVQTKAALELALIFGTAFLYCYWEPNQEIYGVDEHGEPVYKGAPKFKAVNVYDVILDPTKDSFEDQDWVVVREQKNKWDLVALHPELAKEIEDLPRIDTLQYFMPYWETDHDNVWVFTAYHKPTPALPKGRVTRFCENELVLEDKYDNPYRALPIFCIRPEVKYGGAFGHATIFDLLPAQEAHNLLVSSILSNQKAFAVQNVIVFKESNINPAEISGSLNILEVKHVEGAPGGGAPQTLQLCATPPEVFKFADSLVSQMEMVSGINSAARGAPPSNLTSGTAIALIATAANTFNSSVEASYVAMCEDSAGFLIKLLQRFQVTEDLIAIAGKSNTSLIQSFKGEDVSAIKRVRINVGNPISKTLSGKVMVADNLLQNQSIKTPAEYLEILETGTVTEFLEHATAQEAYIRSENDLLAQGQHVQMLQLDDHVTHAREHLTLTFRNDVRNNANILAGVLSHIQQHIDAFETMSQNNPQILALALGQPIQVQPPAPGGVQAGPNTQPGPQPGAAATAPPNPLGEPPQHFSQTAKAAEQSGPAAVAGSAVERANKEMQKVQ